MFRNEPFLDFSVAPNRVAFADQVANYEAKFKHGPVQVPVIMSGKERFLDHRFERVDPNDGTTRITSVSLASVEIAEQALERAEQAIPMWRKTPVRERATVLRKTAAVLRKRRLEIAALMTFEAGKPWKEADADIAEAIDFCEYYALEMERLGQASKTAEVPGEDNRYFYQPRGVAVVIAPWNFPLAIATGMTVAAIVAGNPTILKPAESTCAVAYELAKALLEGGLPPEVFTLLPGKGSVVGSHMVQSPKTDLICFTGSKEVGLEIMRSASQVHPGQRSIKRVIAELGGKNAVIVDDDADLDEAVKGVLYSAFGYAGQKCSACSRLIVVGSAYEPLLERLTEAAGSIVAGRSNEAGTFLGPVIDKNAADRISSIIEAGTKQVRIAFKGEVPPTNGFFVPATIFRDVPRGHSLWQEEIFGPVLSCAQSPTFDAALELANDCAYALTGGIFSRNPTHIEKAREEFRVGNLYINRGCTGALVCRQPFGGFRMSGVGSKAGGPDYLLQFLEPRCVTENTMRRGFAPE